jgi:peptide/nickel transport system substrate-binding protein
LTPWPEIHTEHATGQPGSTYSFVFSFKRSLPLALFLYVLTFGTGCRPAQSIQSSPITLRWGGALTVTGGARFGINILVDNLVGDPLFGIDWTGRVQPRLAEDWEWSPDHLTLTIKLRQGIKFHDGSPLDAQRVSDLLLRRIHDQDASSYADVSDVIPQGTGVVTIRLKRPNAFLLADLAESTIRDPRHPGLETGAFRTGALKPQPELIAFDEYYRGRPKIDRLEIRPYDTLRGAWAAMMRGDIDVLQDVGRDTVEFVEAESSVQVYRFVRPYYYPLVFNLKNPALQSKEVRQALSQAVDRETIVAKALHGRGRVADGPVWPSHWAHPDAQRRYTYNPDAARLRLDSAGMKVNGASPSGRMPSRLRFSCLLVATEQAYDRLALYLQRQFADVGVDMQLEPVSYAEFVQRVKAGQFDAFLMELVSARSLTWTYGFWHSSNPFFKTGYSSADATLERMRSATSDEDTRSAVAELQRVLYDDPPAIFIAWPETTRAVRATFEVPADSNPDVMGTLWRWRPQSPILQARR